MPTLSFDVLRHGETTGGAGVYIGRTDWPLSTQGWQQMDAALQAHTAQYTQVITSPLQRCAAFANAYAKANHLEIHTQADWQEYAFGLWEGRSGADLYAQYPQALSDFWQDPIRYPPPEAEHLPAFGTRIANALSRLIHQNLTHSLVVTHAGVIRVLLCWAQGQSLHHLLSFNVPFAALYQVHITWAHPQDLDDITTRCQIHMQASSFTQEKISQAACG
ncbi:alpha-ribazole phosphatase [Allopseudospirillum japonicum]|uniref:Alpha-ribazole phosphatase n=1 Tax=Allopseudospirillum japonicum TaxID=64971 RepID=A0A1H6U7Q0_9GAMM|nr:histidine phosphatase family protein [Allopseudospirillum japonicum]SEI83902.1 alpha-ribazole phosphatase [Allopseudospirillum japonicum]